MTIIIAALIISAIYCAGMYGFLFWRSIKFRIDYEQETFHLGLCFTLAIGFLGVLLK